MNWLSEIDDSEQQSINEMNAGGLGKAPKQPKKEAGLFDGAATAIPRGVAAGAVKVYDTAKKPFERVADHLQYSIDDVRNGGLDGALDVREKSFSDVHEEKNKDRRDALVMQVEELQDAPNSGLVGNMLFGISDMGTRVLAGAPLGPVGAALTTGVTEVNYSREDLIHKGVDEDTATTAALIDGGVAAASTVLPLSYGFKGTGGLVKDAALSIGGATTLSTAGQYASGQVLESEGYDKQAKKYEITGESVATDVVLNTLMFGGARGTNLYLERKAERKAGLVSETPSDAIDVTPEQLEAKTTQTQSALVANEVEFDNAASPVKPSNPVQANNHFKNMDDAQNNLRIGRPVNVQHAVKGEEKQRPITISPSEYKNIRYDDPRLDALLGNKAKSMDMEWAVPLLTAVRRAGEKSHNNQVSPKGAQSIMQIMPETKAGLERTYKKKWDINNPEHATEMALYLVREMSQQYKTKDPFVLAAHYNGGFTNGKAMQKNGKPKATETINYVNRVKDFINTGKYKNYTGNNVSTSMGMDGSSYDFAYEVKSLGELIASNDAAYGVNPLYPTDLQPRDRTREASRQQIENMADDLKPEWLGESAKLSDGAPIIGVDNVVESGNGRTLAINRAYETGKADNYRAYIEKYAAEKGWDISGVDRPVLVRTRLTDTDRVQFTKLANEADVAQYSASERATSDVDRLPDASLLKINNDGSINLDGSMDFIRGFVNSLPESEKPNILTDDGRLSQGGKQRIESAIMQSAYDDSSLVTRLYENIDDDSKTVLNALLRAAPQLAQLGALVKQGGRHANTLAKDLSQAAQKLSDLKANGQTVDDYLNQIQLIDDGLSNGAKQFLNVFDTNKRSAKAISDNIQGEIDRIDGMGDPRQGLLFGDGPEESAALDIIMHNPDQQISVSRMRPDGEMEEITMSLRERLDELEAEARQAQEDTLAAQTAISCALQFGE
ncbi:transglycosylase SLT domain-containing protein [Acinetobacter sp. MF4640]|uniref:transglycosylase SLT domain-containing protein n=1 Tax=Acinetobacter sp. MF4640 TaxID=1960826 RepID=UPI00099584FF|nr:transglycosylase SLT domain-containing protein [Acinetobacter sp. MF4640]OOW09649.1 transglycosylase [Acinetobacter sp. MF4640]